jgi:hypothetical protein
MYLNAQGALMSIWFNDSPFFIEIDVYRFIKRGVNITVPFGTSVETYGLLPEECVWK